MLLAGVEYALPMISKGGVDTMIKNKLGIGLSVGAVVLALALSSVAFAHDTNTNNSNHNGNTNGHHGQALTASQLLCIQTAVTARETTLQNDLKTLETAWNTALAARATALNAAWGLSDPAARQTAINAAWKAYNTAIKTAKKTLQKADHQAWSTYNQAAKTCIGTGIASEDHHGEGSDVLSALEH